VICTFFEWCISLIVEDIVGYGAIKSPHSWWSTTGKEVRKICALWVVYVSSIEIQNSSLSNSYNYVLSGVVDLIMLS
jgi:hypothetical protein